VRAPERCFQWTSAGREEEAAEKEEEEEAEAEEAEEAGFSGTRRAT
jgi:hypothetical protein